MNKKTKKKSKMRKRSSLVYPILGIILSSLIIAIFYGNAYILIGGNSIIPIINLDMYMFVIFLGFGITSLIITCLFKGRDEYHPEN
jgi:hypothetical protein